MSNKGIQVLVIHPYNHHDSTATIPLCSLDWRHEETQRRRNHLEELQVQAANAIHLITNHLPCRTREACDEISFALSKKSDATHRSGGANGAEAGCLGSQLIEFGDSNAPSRLHLNRLPPL